MATTDLEEGKLSSIAHINGLQDVAGFGIAQLLDAKLLLRLYGSEKLGNALDRDRILLGRDGRRLRSSSEMSCSSRSE